MKNKYNLISNRIDELEKELKNNSDLTEEEKSSIDMEISNLYYDIENYEEE